MFKREQYHLAKDPRASNKNWNFMAHFVVHKDGKICLPSLMTSVRIWPDGRTDRYGDLRHHNYNADKNPFIVSSSSFVPEYKVSIHRFN